jgi:S-methylmethionine-dependent homocysteine/selenocysteine methylase
MTAFSHIQARLDRGDVIILDGASGTELQLRGVPMHGFAWSGAALDTHPDAVREMHEDYVRAGADVLITDTFATARHVLEPAGLGDRVRALNARAVELAQEARERAGAGRPVAIAGSLSSFRSDVVPGDQLESSYREQAEVLAEAGVDLLALEMLSGAGRAAPIIRAALATGLPIWAGFSCKAAADGGLQFFDGGPFAAGLPQTLALLAEASAATTAVTVMHSLVPDSAPALEIVQASWSGPTGVYAHAGRWVDPEWEFTDMISPEDYLGFARRWVQMGARIIGGCCGIGPEHVRLLREQLT